ncbi:MAG: hydrogenase formation protein HypD [Verrucomicrobiota bacterium]|jgi:hydrogenase expression/formation protein HypD|nr:hydrogenase formation protein HypD [Verrucomicrobiota bacterium]
MRTALAPLLAAIRPLAEEPVRLMEVCGGQTHAILHYGLDTLLPAPLELLHGPGCPVCVTPASYLDHAIAIARHSETVLCTFGDLLRVPSGASGDLYAAKAAGADVRIVLSPLHALDVAKENPARQVVLLAIGFETTAPANALAIHLAKERRLSNFSALVSHFLVPPILRHICAEPAETPDGFLAAGHVCAVTGAKDYAALAAELHTPIAITGFAPEEILYGILRVLQLRSAGQNEMANAYAAVVRPEGNPAAKDMIRRIFEPADREWRGLGLIPDSGLTLRPAYAEWDAAHRFPMPSLPAVERPATPEAGCPAAEVLLGRLSPPDCPHFGTTCSPDAPRGAPMVSPEGACAAFFLNRRDS